MIPQSVNGGNDYPWMAQLNLLMTAMTVDGWLTKHIVYGNDQSYDIPTSLSLAAV